MIIKWVGKRRCSGSTAHGMQLDRQSRLFAGYPQGLPLIFPEREILLNHRQFATAQPEVGAATKLSCRIHGRVCRQTADHGKPIRRSFPELRGKIVVNTAHLGSHLGIGNAPRCPENAIYDFAGYAIAVLLPNAQCRVGRTHDALRLILI